MAGLSLRRPDDSESRAQVLLVGAFGIAVFLIVVAGVLNAVTYTDSLAGRTDDVNGGRDVAAFRADARAAAGGALSRVNTGAGYYTEKDARIRTEVGNWSDDASRQYERDVTGVNVDVVDTTEGSRVEQTTNRTLTNASGVENWTLAEDVSRTREFELTLSRSSLTNGSCATDSCYTVVVNDTTDSWRLAVNRSVVVVDGPGSLGGQCSVATDPVVVDLTGGTVGDTTCAPLTFAEGLTAPHEIRYRNGSRANGTYQAVVDRPASAVRDDDYAANGTPTVSPVVYDATVRVTYHTSETYYATNLTVTGADDDA